jgi:hypothetical protein
MKVSFVGVIFFQGLEYIIPSPLSFRVSAEISVVFMMGLLFYVTCSFSIQL